MRRAPDHVHCRGRRFEVQDTLALRGRPYWIVGRLGNSNRRKLQVFDPAARDLRVVHLLPRTQHTKQQLRVLRRTGRLGGFAKILDVTHRQEELMVLTDWIWGDTVASILQQLRSRKKRWPSAHTAWQLYARFVHAVAQLHDFTMCAHGDIKPQNVVIQAEPQCLRLIDFGSAWCEEHGRHRDQGDGHALGYAAPELHGDDPATVLADQFSAAVLFYELVSGQLPYEGLGGRAGWLTYRDAFADKLVPPSELCQGDSTLPRAGWKLIDNATARSLSFAPEDRFPTTNAWRDAVDEVTRHLNHAQSRPLWEKRLAAAADRVLDLFSRGKARS